MAMFFSSFTILCGIIIVLFPEKTLYMYREFHKSVGTKIKKGQISVGFWRAGGIIFIIIGLMMIMVTSG